MLKLRALGIKASSSQYTKILTQQNATIPRILHRLSFNKDEACHLSFFKNNLTLSARIDFYIFLKNNNTIKLNCNRKYFELPKNLFYKLTLSECEHIIFDNTTAFYPYHPGYLYDTELYYGLHNRLYSTFMIEHN